MKNNKAPYRSLLTGLMLSATVIAAPVSTYAVQTDTAASTSSTPIIRDRIIVKYRPSSQIGIAATMAPSSLAKSSATAGVTLGHIRQLATGAQLLKLQNTVTDTEIDTIITNLMADPNVEYAERDLLLQPMATPSDPRYNEQWHYFESTGGLNLPPAWDVTQGQGTVVAVIDTGYRPHQDLNANLLPGYDMISDRNIAQDGNGRDANAIDPGDWTPAGACGAGSPRRNSSWHGTHVAGTIAAVTNNGVGVAGVAYKAKIVPVRVLGRCGGYTSDIADGMIWAAGGNVSGTPTNANPAKVLNLSLGGRGACGTTQQAAINTARRLGATVVVAAGNSNANAQSFTPANCNGVISVASTNRNGGKAYYSNFGNVVDVAAPGGDSRAFGNGVLSTLNSGSTTPGGDRYAFYQGTSMATPHVAGAAALLYAVKPSITANKVEQILKSTARSFPASCNQCGAGIVDAAAAVTAANGGTQPQPTNSLKNGEPKTGLSGARRSQTFFTMEVPAGTSNVVFKLRGGSGDADMYVRFGSKPSLRRYDCRPYKYGNNETCVIDINRAGTYHIMIRGYRSFSATSLVGQYN